MKLKMAMTLILFWSCWTQGGTQTWAQTQADAKTTRFVLEFSRPLTAVELQNISQQIEGEISLLTPVLHPYFSRVYVVETAQVAEELKRLPLLLKVESSIAIETQSVNPSGKSPSIGNDPFNIYQWGLENTGQTVHFDMDDITIGTRSGKLGLDIGLANVKHFDQQMKRKIVIAVIDSGVDIDHPELKEHIFKNEAECLNGEIPLQAKEDKDGNGYLGDCKGWDFTGKKKEGSNRQIDDLGHGTHVAGIIAADTNDSVGIRGISNQIQILPLKVLSADSERKHASGFSDRLAGAILYAVEKRVSIINLSLGWPLYLDRKHLREAVEAAKKAGILIVAASGNNNHGAPLLPCAIREVLCVGSLNNNGTISGFSNYGSHVDVVAPGDNILSTIPRSLKSIHFPIIGYDYKSGTSQAAPLVSGVAAVLMGTSDELSADEARSILVSTSQSLTPNQLAQKHFRAGLVRIDRALARTITNPVTLDYKETERTGIWKDNDPTFEIELPLKNHSNQTVTGTLALASSREFHLKQNTISFQIPAKGNLTVKTTATLKNTQAERIQSLQVQIKTGGHTHSQIYDLELLRDAHGLANSTHIPLDFETSSNIYSLKRFGTQSASPRFYEATKSADTITVKIIAIGSTSATIEKQAELKGVDRLIQIRELDVDGDLDMDLQVIALMNAKDEKSEKTVRYFNWEIEAQSRRPGLFGGFKPFQEIELAVESVLEIETEHNFIQMQKPGSPTFAVPFFMATGTVPKVDQPKDPFEPRVTAEDLHLYYFVPTLKDETWQLETRILDAPDKVKAWKKELKAKPFQTLSLLHLLSTSTSSTLHILASLGSGFQRTPYLMSVHFNAAEPTVTWHQLSSDVVIDGYALDKTFHLSDTNRADLALIGQVNDTTWVKSFLTDSGISSVSLKSEDPTETINSYIQSYSKDEFHFSFLQTVSELLFTVESKQGLNTYTTPFHVSTFLPGQIYQEKAWAIWLGQKQSKEPALYVDATQILSRSAYLVVGNKDGLRSPAHMSLHIPNECMANNPSLWNNDQYQFTLICRVKDHFEFRFVPMD